MLRYGQVLIWIGVAIFSFAALLWFADSSPSFRHCVQETTTERDTQNPQPINGKVSVLSGISTYRDCAGQFVRKDNGAITALATVLLTFVTAILVRMAFQQNKTTRAQLRAYVFVNIRDRPVIDEKRTLKVVIFAKNSGQTPAYEAKIVSSAGIISWPPPRPRAEIFKDVDAANITKITIGPGDAPANIPEMLNITADETAGLEKGDLRIVVWGRVEYKDAFGTDRLTKFAYSIKREKDEFSHPYYEEGFNWAT